MRAGKYGTVSVSVVLVLGLSLAGCGNDGQDRAQQSQGDETAEERAAVDPAAVGQKTGPDASGDPGCSVTMGWDPWEPYQFKDESGEVRGLDVELVRRIAAEANCEVTLQEGNWEALLNRLRHGELDLLTGASKTDRRTQFAHFSDPYRDETFVLYVRSEDMGTYDADTLAGLLDQGFRLGVTSSYYYGEKVSALRDNPEFSGQFVPAPISELNYSRLLDYSIDGFLEDPFVAAAILRGKGLSEEISEYPVTLDTGPVHLMFSKESVDPGTLDRFNKALAKLKTTGVYDEIIEKYRE